MATHVAESKRLHLVPLTLDAHLESYHVLNSDERVSRWSNRAPTKTLDDAKALMLSRLPSPLHPYIENYAIVLKPTFPSDLPPDAGRDGNENGNGKREEEEGVEGEMIGVLGIPRLSHDGDAAEVGYGLLPAFWGRGLASEALSLFVEYYFSSTREFQKEMLVAETETENVASERVLAKAGFERGELVRDAFEVVDLVTGEKGMRDAVPWRLERPRL